MSLKSKVIKLRKMKNKMLLSLGFVLVNKHGFTVYLKDGKQIKSNRRRKLDYSLDDKSWRVA